jgi:hypothetical protein
MSVFLKKATNFLSIPFLLLNAIYFIKVKDKTSLEYMLLLFSIVALILTTFFVYKYVDKK